MTPSPVDAESRIPIVTVEDDLRFRAALISFLEEEGEFVVVGRAASCEEALAVATSEPPDVVLLDVRLRDGSGLELVGPLHKRWPGSKIIILTMFEVPPPHQRARQREVSGFVAKADLARDLLPAIHQALAS